MTDDPYDRIRREAWSVPEGGHWPETSKVRARLAVVDGFLALGRGLERFMSAPRPLERAALWLYDRCNDAAERLMG
jgi:hypothetical protein